MPTDIFIGDHIVPSSNFWVMQVRRDQQSDYDLSG